MFGAESHLGTQAISREDKASVYANRPDAISQLHMAVKSANA